MEVSVIVAAFRLHFLGGKGVRCATYECFVEDGLIHISHFDHIVHHDAPMHEHVMKAGTEAEKRIGELIATNLVQDGATLQMGIGSIPDAVLSCLTSHKDLGIHTEMFSDGVLQLVEDVRCPCHACSELCFWR